MDKIVRFVKDNSVDEGFLQNWYQSSVIETDKPVWTDEHLAELSGDFYLIPKETVEKLEKEKTISINNPMNCCF